VIVGTRGRSHSRRRDRTDRAESRGAKRAKTPGEVALLFRNQLLGVALGDVDKIVPVAGIIAGWTALDRDGMGDQGGVDHVDRVPGANLGAMLATDAAIEIDVAPGLQTRMLFTRNFIDTIDGANFKAGFAAGATISVNDREDLGDDLTRLAGE